MSTGTFEHVGPRVEFGDVAISAGEAELFRKSALQGIKVKELVLDDDETRIVTSAYTSGFLSDAAADYDVYSSAFYSKTTMGANPDFWRSVITFARFNSKQSDTKIYNIFDVESYQGEPTFAARRVRVIRNLSRIAFDENGDPFEDTYSHQRKTFETPMTSEDVTTALRRVEGVINRSRATRGR